MSNPFLAMLAVALVLGVALGGAFVGGVVLGRSQAGDADQANRPERLPPSVGTSFAGQPGDGGAGQARQGFGPPGQQRPQGGPGTAQGSQGNADDGAGEPNPSDTDGGAATGTVRPEQDPSSGQAEPRQELTDGANPGSQGGGQVQGVAGPSGRGSTGGAGIGGTIESVDGERLTITTPQGPVNVVAGAQARIVSFSEAVLQDLSPGIQVRVLGAAVADGDVQAESILIVTDDARDFFGRRPGPRGR